MKTLKDLFEAVAKAVEQNKRETNTWFIDFSGHVNEITVSYWYTGWDHNHPATEQKLRQQLTEEGIQAAYWFIQTRLKEQ